MTGPQSTELVARLRAPAERVLNWIQRTYADGRVEMHDPLRDEAADEIERLRAENEALQAIDREFHNIDDVVEIKRLRKICADGLKQLDSNVAEIGRLRGKLASIRTRTLNLAQWIDKGCEPKHGATEASFIALMAKEPADDVSGSNSTTEKI